MITDLTVYRPPMAVVTEAMWPAPSVSMETISA